MGFLQPIYSLPPRFAIHNLRARRASDNDRDGGPAGGSRIVSIARRLIADIIDLV